MTSVPAHVLQSSLDDVVARYDAYGPLVAAFLANLLATFGDKGQLVVVTLASKYDAKRVFVGAMAAFTLWSAIEVVVGSTVVRVLPAETISLLTGVLFLAFGAWTLATVVERVRDRRGDAAGAVLTGGGLDVGISGRVLPDGVLEHAGAYGGVLSTFAFIAFAEFGDKTQLLTINLAATFPESKLAVFAGVIAALGLRTGVDAVIGERFERWVPRTAIEVVAAGVFVLFGLLVLGVVSTVVLVAYLAVVLALGACYVVAPASVRARFP